MSKVTINSTALKKAVNLVKIVKPEFNDFCFSFSPGHLRIFSYDRRKKVVCNLNLDSSLLDEFYLSIDKASLFDIAADSIEFSIADTQIKIKSHTGSSAKQATLKRKSSKIKRLPIPVLPTDGDCYQIDKKTLIQLLSIVSASALIKETKTDEEMKINQIHFYQDYKSVFSSARYYGSCAFSDRINFNLSIVSSDIPYIKNFISKINSDLVRIYQLTTGTYFVDDSDSFLFLGKVNSQRPSFSAYEFSGFKHQIKVSRTNLEEQLEWADKAVDGTQRISFIVNDSKLYLKNGSEEIAEMNIDQISNTNFTTDLPILYLSKLIESTEGESILIGFNHEKTATLMGITDPDSSVKYLHLIQSMRSR